MTHPPHLDLCVSLSMFVFGQSPLSNHTNVHIYIINIRCNLLNLSTWTIEFVIEQSQLYKLALDIVKSIIGDAKFCLL